MAQEIVDQAIMVSGGDRYQDFRVKFKFRDIEYIADRQGGKYSYERLMQEESGEIHDILNNEGFTRLLKGKEIQVIDTMAAKYSRSVNSVLYFALLPYGLNDAAVVKKYLGITTFEGNEYHKIQVTFRQDGGGEDFEDIFVYWINVENYFIDYFGYKYETDGGGMRFRKAKNPRFLYISPVLIFARFDRALFT